MVKVGVMVKVEGVSEGLRVGREPGRLIILVQRAHYLAEFCRVLKFWTRHDTAPGEAQPHFMNYMTLADVFLTRP
ncbi:hypothetical protein O3P69_017355 [Scylla paramamosain]|uniref:Uncharacterized protein n=1 Tax=Scylla paramamosain TaxID=85552 RepID=A0AAW0SGP9_SCYPA